MFKVNNRNTRTKCDICSKLIIKANNNKVNNNKFNNKLSLLLTLNIFTPCCTVSIVNFEQVNANWG